MLIENFTYLLRFQFLLFLYVFLKNRMNLTLAFTRKIISINFIFFVLNLSVGFLFGLGLESYRFQGTSKGMFQGGNPVSILNLIFLLFIYLMDPYENKYCQFALQFLMLL